jgi:hypothetical protein
LDGNVGYRTQQKNEQPLITRNRFLAACGAAVTCIVAKPVLAWMKREPEPCVDPAPNARVTSGSDLVDARNRGDTTSLKGPFAVNTVEATPIIPKTNILPAPAPRPIETVQSNPQEKRTAALRAEVMQRCITRDRWGVQSKEVSHPKEFFRKDQLTGIVIHHTASPNGRPPGQDLSALMDHGKLPYHFVIDRDGKIYAMTEDMWNHPDKIPVGEHAKGYNGAQSTLAKVGGSIGIALIGQFEDNPQNLQSYSPADAASMHPTGATIASLALLLAYIRSGYESSNRLQVLPHRDVRDWLQNKNVDVRNIEGTQCPGSRVMAVWDTLITGQEKLMNAKM